MGAVWAILSATLLLWLTHGHHGWAVLAFLIAAAAATYGGLVVLTTLNSMRGTIVNESTEETAALWAISGLFLPTESKLLPQLGGYALEPTAAHQLLQLFVQHQIATVVELGCGSSTVLMSMFSMQLHSRVQIYSVEAEPLYAERLQRWLGYHDATNCEVLVAPLEELQLPQWRGRWYSPLVLDRLPNNVDLLVIDGPANERQIGARFPALPLLTGHLADGALIFVDDTDRPDERRMVERWQADGLVEILDRRRRCTVLRYSAPPE